MKQKPTKISFTLTLLASSMMSMASAEGTAKLEEMVVTAQKRDQNLHKVPVSIGVLNSKDIENTMAASLSETANAIPSVNFGRNSRKSRGEITIRGVGDFSRNIGVDSRVTVYIDDVPLPRSSAFELDLLDVKQVEVFRGPQGTLFGTNTVAGAINIITNDPSDDFSGAIRLDAGNFGKKLVSLKTDIPLSSNLKSSLTIGVIEEDGHIENIATGEELQGTDLQSGRLKLKYSPSDAFNLRIGFDWLEDDTLATNGEAIGTDPQGINGFIGTEAPFEVAHDADEFEYRKYWGGSIKADYSLTSGFDIVSITAYRDNEFEEQSEEDYSTAPVATSIFDETSSQFSQELRLISPANDKTDYVIGLFYSSRDIETERSAALVSQGTSVVTPGELTADHISLYAHGNYRFNDAWELSFGARLQSESKDLEYTITDSTGLFTDASIVEEDDYTTFLPKLGVNYYLSQTSFLYASVSEGTKSGGWNADFVRSLDDIDYKEEFATNYEIGYKGLYLEERLSVNLTGFVSKFTDFQVFQFVTNNGTTTINLTNAGEATSQGLELDTRFVINANFDVILNAAYTDATFDRFKDGGGPGIDYDGNDLPFAPSFGFYGALNYAKSFENSELNAHIGYSYSGESYSNPNNQEDHKNDSFGLLNSRIALTINEDFELALWGNNLTDDEYLQYRDVSFLNIPRGKYGKPRTYGISGKYKF